MTSYKLCKDPVKSSPPINKHPIFLQAGCPSCRPTNSVKALNGKNITFHGLAYSKLTWGLPTLSLTTNSFRLTWGRVAMSLISPLMPVPHSRFYLSQGSADFLITRKRTDLEEYDDLLRDDRL